MKPAPKPFHWNRKTKRIVKWRYDYSVGLEAESWHYLQDLETGVLYEQRVGFLSEPLTPLEVLAYAAEP